MHVTIHVQTRIIRYILLELKRLANSQQMLSFLMPTEGNRL